jgi:hypothetical protein
VVEASRSSEEPESNNGGPGNASLSKRGVKLVNGSWTRGPNARPVVPQISSFLVKMAVPRVCSINPTRLTCRNESDSNDLDIDILLLSVL